MLTFKKSLLFKKLQSHKIMSKIIPPTINGQYFSSTLIHYLSLSDELTNIHTKQPKNIPNDSKYKLENPQNSLNNLNSDSRTI
jgi:hypothetical protein